MTDIPEGWTAHDGKSMPVNHADFVRPLYRDTPDPAKGIRRTCGLAWQFAWHHDGQDDDIIAYKVETDR